MLFPFKNRQDIDYIKELASLNEQVKELRLPEDRSGKQIFHEDMKEVCEPVDNTIKNTSEKLTETITRSSEENNKALEKLNKKLVEIINDRGILASYLLPPLSKITSPENTSQFKFRKF